MDKLKNAREKINKIDKQMAELFESRMKAVKEIANYKIEHAMPIFDSNREEAVINQNSEYVKSDEVRPYYVNFISDTMSISKRYQHKLLEGMKIAYSGVKGAFAYIAASKIFPDGNLVSYPDFTDAYNSVVTGDCDCAVLPIENSYAGEVGQVIDLLFSGNLFVNGIYELPITHNLLGVKGASIADIKKVVSHTQALNQCREYIKEHGFDEEGIVNTAVAAKTVAELNDKSIAAIAGNETAELYGLEIIEKNINTSNKNTTRFAVFSRCEDKSRGAHMGDNFIMLFTVRHEAGALAKAINIIGKNGFNMKLLRSRSMKALLWEYYFYIEADGNIHSPQGQNMLGELSSCCDKLKIAGTFTSNNELE